MSNTQSKTIKVFRVTKKTNNGYLPEGTTGLTFGTILGNAGYLVIWDHSPEVPLPISSYDIELGDSLGLISIGSRLDYNIDAYRNLTEEFNVKFF